MTLRVYKFPVPLAHRFERSMPCDAEILSVQVQGGEPQMWVLVNPEPCPMRPRFFRMSGTGHDIAEEIIKFIGTFQMNGGGLVFHLFEVRQ